MISPPKSILILGLHPSIPLLCLKKHGFHQISEPKETKTPAHPSVMINLIDSDSLPWHHTKKNDFSPIKRKKNDTTYISRFILALTSNLPTEASKPIQKDLPIASPPSTSRHEDKPWGSSTGELIGSIPPGGNEVKPTQIPTNGLGGDMGGCPKMVGKSAITIGFSY